MSALHEIQTAFAISIRDGNTLAVASGIVADRPGAGNRLQIYQNHFTLTLIETLRSTYPVTCRLVGHDFFAQVARAYMRTSPPTGPCLFEYGGGFPQYIGSLPETRSLVYLRDVCRLEWAINVAFHAPDVPVLQALAFADIPVAQYIDVGLAFHPSVRLVASAFPIDRIWQVNQSETEDIEPVDLRQGGACLLVHRQQDDVGWLKLSRCEFAFLRTLTLGGSLGNAHAVALKLGGNVDVSSLLRACLEGSLISRFTHVC